MTDLASLVLSTREPRRGHGRRDILKRLARGLIEPRPDEKRLLTRALGVTAKQLFPEGYRTGKAVPGVRG